MASLSDCFSKATVSTRSWMPAWISWLATMAVEPPTEPAVWTRNMRLAGGAEGVGQEQLRHHHALEEVGGLADDDGVDVGPGHLGVVEGPLGGLADRPAMETSPRVAWCLVWPMPTTATRSLPIRRLLPARQTRFCWRHGPAGGVGHPAVGLAGGDAVGDLADADEAGGHHRVGGQRPARGVDVDVVAQAEGLAQDQLLVA